MRTDTLVTILGMALVTYVTRAGGFWLMGRVPQSPHIERWLRHIPGAVLVSIVAPTVVFGGFVSWAAAFGAILVAALTRNLLFAMVTGVAVVLLLQSVT